MSVASGSTLHTVLVCTLKPEHGAVLAAILAPAGLKVLATNSVYDAMAVIQQEMPHLVIAEAILSDGTAATLLDRLTLNPILNRTPVVVHLLKKSKEELAPLAGKTFAGFLVGQLDPAAVVKLVGEALAGFGGQSPYYRDVEASHLQKDVAIVIDAQVIGQTDGQVLVRSQMEVPDAASLVCVPKKTDLSPAILKMASNVRKGVDVINFFPLSRTMGKGKLWLSEIPEVTTSHPTVSSRNRPRRVLIYDPMTERFEQFQNILKGHRLELVHAKTLTIAAGMVQNAATIGCIYLHELINDVSSIGWRESYAKLPVLERPPMIIGTSSLAAQSTATVRYIRKPYGLGVFLEMVESLVSGTNRIAEAILADKTTTGGAAVTFQAVGVLIGLDESGGILALKFPVTKGVRCQIQHQQLQHLWPDPVEILDCWRDARTGLWLARFDAVKAGTSKFKYWEKICLILDKSAVSAA